ncbi:hypothetical protein [Clostridioides sp. ZZV15-6598]|uniref:hypothetical protein n=1 Tax=Clostridioides sp. ZZV15-6598 TaxID=2811501 RepID=UPI001D12333C|nr:hypothetical protein [Clostridioides sp. ZZV15-6598]
MTRTRGGEADLRALHKEFDDASCSIVNKNRELVEFLERQISDKNEELRDLENELEKATSIKNRELAESLEKQISVETKGLEDLEKKLEEERVKLERSIAFHNDRD